MRYMNTILYMPEELAGEPFLDRKLCKLSEEEKKNGRIVPTTLDNGQSVEIRWMTIHIPVDEKRIDESISLMITSTDHSLEWAKSRSIATVAYPNPNYPNQSFSGADLIAESFEEIDENYLNRVWQRANGIPWTILTTPRCLLRELCLDDMRALFNLYEQPGITDYMEPLFPWDEELEYEKAYIANMYRFYEYGMWLVFEKDTGELIGRAGLEHRPYPGDVLELEMGYAITPSRQHQGYATEVCTAIIDYAKENLEYKRINCLIEKENVHSIKLMKKLGFKYMETTAISGQPMQRYVRHID